MVLAVVAVSVASGCGGDKSGTPSGGAKSGSRVAAPIAHSPSIRWIAPNPGNLTQGGPYADYSPVAATGDVLVGMTSLSSPDGALSLARLDPADGTQLWAATLPDAYYQAFLAVRDDRILVVAPGSGDGTGPAFAYCFSVAGAKLWQEALGEPIPPVDSRSTWQPDGLPTAGETTNPGPRIVIDVDQIPGVMLIYEVGRLRGFNTLTGAMWTYSPDVTPDRIVGPDPGGKPLLHLVSGSDVVLVNGHTGIEEARTRAMPRGRDIGPNSVGPMFDSTAFEATLPPRDDIEPLTPLDATADGVAYAIINGPLGSDGNTHGDRLAEIDTATDKTLWTWAPHGGSVLGGASAAGDGLLLVNVDRADGGGTALLK